MPTISTGVYRKVYVKRQAALIGDGVSAPGANGFFSVRRVTCTLDLAKATFQSAEIIASQQRRDMRHGARGVTGTLTGELSCGTYQQLFESVCRAAAGPGSATSTGVQTNISLTNVAGGSRADITRAAGSFITDGFNIGDVVRMTGWAAPATGNNTHYAVIVTLTATNMRVTPLDNKAFTAKVAGDSVAVILVGKRIFIPQSNHTRDYYSIEHWYGDISQDETYIDCVFTGFTLAFPPTGIATVEFPIMGLSMIPAQAQYANSPSAPSTGPNLAAVNGSIAVNGNIYGYITGFTVTVNGNYAYPSGDGIVGSIFRPDVLPGPVDVTGQMTLLFVDAVARDAFINEAEVSLNVVLTSDTSPSPQFISVTMSRVKYTGATKDDSLTGLTLTVPFTSLENVANGGTNFPNLPSSFVMQDSAFV